MRRLKCSSVSAVASQLVKSHSDRLCDIGPVGQQSMQGACIRCAAQKSVFEPVPDAALSEAASTRSRCIQSKRHLSAGACSRRGGRSSPGRQAAPAAGPRTCASPRCRGSRCGWKSAPTAPDPRRSPAAAPRVVRSLGEIASVTTQQTPNRLPSASAATLTICCMGGRPLRHLLQTRLRHFYTSAQPQLTRCSGVREFKCCSSCCRPGSMQHPDTQTILHWEHKQGTQAGKDMHLERKHGGLVAHVAADDVRLDGQHPRRPRGPITARCRGTWGGICRAHDGSNLRRSAALRQCCRCSEYARPGHWTTLLRASEGFAARPYGCR